MLRLMRLSRWLTDSAALCTCSELFISIITLNDGLQLGPKIQTVNREGLFIDETAAVWVVTVPSQAVNVLHKNIVNKTNKRMFLFSSQQLALLTTHPFRSSAASSLLSPSPLPSSLVAPPSQLFPVHMIPEVVSSVR